MNRKAVLNMQKIAIGLCALTTLATTTMTIIAAQGNNKEAKVASASGLILSGLGLGLATGAYSSNPYRKRVSRIRPRLRNGR